MVELAHGLCDNDGTGATQMKNLYLTQPLNSTGSFIFFSPPLGPLML